MSDVTSVDATMSKLNQLGYTNDQLNSKLLGFYGNSVDKVVNYYENLNQNQDHEGNHEQTTVLYNLIGFITHIGSNVNSGHYICHLKKDNEWYAFNDTRISKSTNPPIHNAYIYLFQKS